MMTSPVTAPGLVGRINEEPVWLALRSAKQQEALPLAASQKGEDVIKLRVMGYQKWSWVKRHLKAALPEAARLSDSQIRLLYKGVELRSDSVIDGYGILPEDNCESRPLEMQYLIIRTRSPEGQPEQVAIKLDRMVPNTPAMRRLVEAAEGALKSGLPPRLTDEGTGATYMLRDPSNSQTIAVLKPKDEEAFAPLNPRGYIGSENQTGLREGVYSTQQAAREVAAFLLDHDEFAGVPDTTLVHAIHPKFVRDKGEVVWKVAAMQAFVTSTDSAGNFAPQIFEASCVHRIGIFDVRIANMDRNEGNILVCKTKDKYKLIPIDHGLTLPDRLEILYSDVCWMNWPQAKMPFGPAELAYVANLNAQKDSELLEKSLGISRKVLKLHEIITLLLKTACEHGLTLYQIGTLIYRDDSQGADEAKPSPLEEAMAESLKLEMKKSGGAETTFAALDLQRGNGKSGEGFLRERILRMVKTLGKLCPSPTLTPAASPASSAAAPPTDLRSAFDRLPGDLSDSSSDDSDSEARSPDADEIVLPRSVGGYVPPQLRTLQAEALSEKVEDEEVEFVLKRSAGGYVPPHLRRMQAAAADGTPVSAEG
eukprot:TRINITY_DN11458_c0_g2_i1.p1 TRINITY_DN11458_c0_g2~~TRINITY_DN11458_c0_g2_i1.p1  ORF type:complete len:594 (-),score=137.49 TRINITY_DN11458_c0_g2_i1:289-2070(-)